MKPKATIFHFRGYTFDVKSLVISFNYRIEFSNQEPLDFTETITLSKSPRKLPTETLAKFLEPLHLILGISYYKLYIPKKIILPFSLSKEQAQFWNTVYTKGLGEFLYRNKLDPKQIAKFPFVKTKQDTIRIHSKDRILLGIGGGKDSVVAAELLKDFDVTSFLVETERKDPITKQVIDTIGNPSLTIHRNLDQKIFKKYEGSYNGHIPISAVFAFLGLLSAALYDYRYIMVGNAESSNFGNLTYKELSINHQWSKTSEFETLFQTYTRNFITPDITYCSLLRQFYEIRIAKMLAKYPKYLPVISSCNRSFKVFEKRSDTLWCGECAKCTFVFLLLAPHIQKEKLIKIFGKNMLADEKLIPLYKDLLGFGTMKPFDCVGPFEESLAALYLASSSYKDDIVVKTFLSKIKNGEILVQKVMRTTPALTLPTPFRFLGIENVAIIGYDREGKVTEKYLKKFYPKLTIGILDQKLDKEYLKKQVRYDLAIKTPGIPKERITIPYTTATNIFFSKINNTTIGITGTKGKSTTTSLVYHIFKTAGKKVRLLGNIGSPMLGALLGPIDPKEIFVLELSSYMLDDIEYSPHTAVLLNLFPEHMTYHGSVANYYAAKQNIFKFQKLGDHALTSPYNEHIPIAKEKISLVGEHNYKNIQAAIHVARLYDISETAIKKALQTFKPLPHRLQNIGTKNGITFYDDAISTTPESTIMAIKTLKNIGTIFLGGEDRGYNFKELEKTIRMHKIKNIVLFPDTGKRILTSRKGLNVLETRSMKSAIAFAYKNTPKGSICLLSTASPSYSVWKNFEEKGAEFKKFALGK